MSLTGKCGIILACLIDPLSQIISKIIGLKEDDVNAVGFYYSDTMTKQYRTLLFNSWNSNPVSWMKLGCGEDLLFSSPFINKIVYYSYNGNDIQFRASVVKTIATNKSTEDYSQLLLKSAKLSEENLTTGYDLVNAVLGCKNILSCSLLSHQVSITSTPVKISDEDTEAVLEETRKEITNLLATFINLFTTNKSFSFNILHLNTFNPRMILLEDQLISYLIAGFDVGIVSNYALNTIVRDFNQERLGQNKLLPLFTGNKTVTVTDDDLFMTFQFQPGQVEIKPLEDLGIYIKQMISSLEDPCATTINLNDIVSCYNNLVQDTELSKIEYPLKIISKEAILTTSFEDISISVNSKMVPLTMYNGNLTRLTESQLIDVLVYIDSLRDSTGGGDSKFSSLQNKIVHELGSRQKKRY